MIVNGSKTGSKYFEALTVKYVNRAFKIRIFLRSRWWRLKQEGLALEREILRTADAWTANLRCSSKAELIEKVKNLQNAK